MANSLTTSRLGQPLTTTRLGQPFWKRLKKNSGFLFVAPAVLIFLVFGLYTIIYSFALSFFRWKGSSIFSIFPPVCQAPGCAFWGLQNYKDFLYADAGVAKLFWMAMGNNLVVALVVPTATILISLLVAIALNRAGRIIPVFRTLMMLPMVTAGIAVYFAWSSIYLSDGPLNAMLNAAGLGFLSAPHGWLGTARTSLPALMVVMIWSSVPLAVILYLSGLQTIDKDLYEAATIDGANSWHMLWYITWPLLRPITFIILIFAINSAFQGFDLPLLMTKGGPANHTQVVGLRIFSFGFGDDLQLGIASAMGWVLFLLVFVLSLINLRLFRPATGEVTE